MNKSRLLGAVCACAFTLVTTSTNAVTFTPLGFLSGDASYNSTARAISADGKVVVGYGQDNGGHIAQAFRWTRSTGMVGLNGFYSSGAYAVSSDGSVIVGQGQEFLGDGSKALRWTEAGGMISLGSLPGGSDFSQANDISYDGSIVIGSSNTVSPVPFEGSTTEAMMWTQEGGMVGLGSLSGGTYNSGAHAISADGLTVVGSSSSENGGHAFRWTQEDGIAALGGVPNGYTASNATAISNDGAVVIGTMKPLLATTDANVGSEAMIWTQGDGMVSLGDFDGGRSESFASDVSADGSIIVGWGHSDIGREAFIWDADNGMQSIVDLLLSDGIDMTGWALDYAWGISADGFTLAGNGINPDGITEAWIVNMSNVPIPAAAWLFGSGLLGLIGVARRKSS